MYFNIVIVMVDNLFGGIVNDIDLFNYIGVFINVEKVVDCIEICVGEEVNFMFIVCLLGVIEGF